MTMPRPAPLRWPDNARIAVLPQLGFEAFLGERVEPTTAPLLPEEELRAGATNLAARAWVEYGSKIGGWRILDLFRKYRLPATGLFSGVAVERYPEFARAWVDAGNEIAGHSYAQDIRMFELTADEERANARKCIEVISDVTGCRPVGWNSPGGFRSEHTTRILLEEGYYYSYDYKDDDRPHAAEVIGGRTMVAVPKLFDINDATTHSRMGQAPSVYVEIFCRSFDMLYEEGASDGKMLSLSAHAPMYGRPFGVSALEECIRYARSFPDVWFATGRQVADWWLRCGNVTAGN